VAALAGATAASTYHYRDLSEEDDTEIGKATRTVQQLVGGGLSVHVEWIDLRTGNSGVQEYVVDAARSTRSWVISHPGEDTGYRGIRDGEKVIIIGSLKGELIDTQIKIGKEPFYYNPAVGMQGFILSGEKKTEFRVLRPKDLNQYKMKAQVKGEEQVTIDGTTYDAIKVKWGLTGLKSKFFSQYYWFRKSDGLFIKSSPHDGYYTEFVSEEAQETTEGE